MDKRTTKKGIKELLDSGATFAGSLGTAAMSAAMTNMPSNLTPGALEAAAGGVVIQQVLSKVGAEITDRWLSPTEKARIGATTRFVYERIKRNLDAGVTPREDGFLESRGNERPKAEELLEGVLLKARDAFEEKKLPYLGNLYGNIAFRASVAPAEGNLFLQQAEVLTYRQFVCMALLPRKNRFALKQSRYEGGMIVAYSTVGVLQEILGLGQRALVLQRGMPSDKNELLLEINQIWPSNLDLAVLGILMHDLLNLDEWTCPGIVETCTLGRE